MKSNFLNKLNYNIIIKLLLFIIILFPNILNDKHLKVVNNYWSKTFILILILIYVEIDYTVSIILSIILIIIILKFNKKNIEDLKVMQKRELIKNLNDIEKKNVLISVKQDKDFLDTLYREKLRFGKKDELIIKLNNYEK